MTSQSSVKSTRRRPVDVVTSGKKKLFVLDTNVMMHDPTCLFRFEEHDIYIPMVVLEELDKFKKGTGEVERNTRQALRFLNQIVSSHQGDVEDGFSLSSQEQGDGKGRLFFQSNDVLVDLPVGVDQNKADNTILAVVKFLKDKFKEHEVILVSKDINMRIKSLTVGITVQDYYNDKVIEDTELLYSGMLKLPANFWTKHKEGQEIWQEQGFTLYRVKGPLCSSFFPNQMIYMEGASPLQAVVKEVKGKVAVIVSLKDYTHQKNAVWGIKAFNREQNFALNLLMDPEIDFVTLTGQAGTGKTLLTLAAALAQTLDSSIYTEIIVTRATVPMGEDIGFLPGTEEDKMMPWMGAIEDNLDVLLSPADKSGWRKGGTIDLIQNRLKVKSLNFMRGRTFYKKFLIIDEAQNLTPKQMKALVTRAGSGTKVVCLGNLAQIDTPYLTEGSSGLSYAVDSFKSWKHSGHITLTQGERSRLADWAVKVL